MRMKCAFDNIQNYPFGSQTCEFIMYFRGASNEFTRLVPGNLTYNPRNVEIGGYIIQGWRMESFYSDILNRDLILVSMDMFRNFQRIFLVNYLPTIFMNLINQATNYIQAENKYDMIYTINVTCMMVLASVYISVSVNLPSTSKLKPIELWLIFNLAFPFLVILSNILLQVNT